MARLEITSLAFMLDWVPEPVCHTDEREMRVELALDDLLGGGDDRLADFGVEPAERHIGLGRRALDDAERAHDRQRAASPSRS